MAQGKSDGTVYIDTQIDTSGIGKGVEDTKSKLNSVSNSVKKFGDSVKKAFSSAGTTQGTKSSFVNYENQIKKLELQLDKLIEKQIRFVETGGNAKSRTFTAMEYDIAQVSARLEELRAKKTAFDSLSVSEQRAIENSQMLSNTISFIKSSFANLLPNLKAATKSMFLFAGKGILNGIKKLGTQIKKLATSLFSVGKGAKKSNRSLLMMVGSSLLFSAVFRAINGLINGFKEGINNLVQYSSEANKSMSALKSALAQLKNSLGTAFMPLITIVTPALVSFINTLSKAFTMVGAFFSALSGKSTYTKAVAVQKDYAEGLKDTSKNAKDAKKSLNQYLSGLDEIRTFTAKQNDEEQEETGISPSDMFTEEAVPTSIADFANKIKEIVENLKNYFKNQDWNGLGKYLASGVNKALQFLYDVLNWKNVKDKVMPFIKGFTETFNSLVDNIDWNLLGRTIGTAINTLVNILFELITGIDWKNLGIKFGEGLNGLVSEIDWSKAGETLGEAVKALLDLIIGFLEETDWQQIGKAVADFIGGIDWSGIASRLFEGLGAALGALAGFLVGLLSDAWTSVVEWWKEVAYEDGKFTMQGLLDGILEVFKDIGSWIVENIFNPFINGFKEAFGIHSPSKVMAEMGVFIMQGLLNGVKSLFGDLRETFEELKKIFVSKLQSIKTKWDEKWESFSDKVKDVWGNITDTVSSAIEKIKGWIGDIIDKFNDAKSKFGSGLSFGKNSSAGINIPKVKSASIPMLANGTVIPPNAPFMAILGDQRRGTNIEAPLDTIKQAVKEVVGNSKGGVLHAHLYLDGREIFDTVIDMAKMEQTANGVNPMLLT